VISLDYSLGFQIINFLLLIFILNVLLYKPLLGMIDKRKKQFEESEAEIKHLQGTVEEKMAAYTEKLRQSKTAAIERKNDIISQGAEEAKAVIHAVRAEIPGVMEQFHVRMAGELGDARKVLTAQSRKLSLEIAEKVMGRSLR
jgi:F-type H+-transporting ATPase subunit b